MRVLLIFFVVQRFPEEAPKLSVTFLIMLPTFSKKGLQRFWRTCLIYPREMASFVPSDLFRRFSDILAGLFDHHPLVWWRFLRALCILFSPLSLGFSEVIGRTAPQLRATSREVPTFYSVSLVS